MIWHDAYKSPFSSWGAYLYDQNVKRHLDGRAAPAPSAAPLASSDFDRSTGGKDVVAQLLASAPPETPGLHELDSHLRTLMTQLASAGRKDNVATSLATAIAAAYRVLERPPLDDAQLDALVPALNDVLVAQPQFAQLAMPARQEMHDGLLLAAAVMILLANQGEAETSKAIAKELLQSIGAPAV